MDNEPHVGLLAYFITFRCYGTWLHGDARGSVDRGQTIPGTDLLPPNESRESAEAAKLKHAPVSLSAAMREVTDAAIREACEYRDWPLAAINVRTNHVHTVVTADGTAPSRSCG